MTLVIDTTSITEKSRKEFIDSVEPTFKLAETPWDEGATTMYRLERRDGKEMSPVDGGNATLAAYAAGLKVLRAE